MSRDRSLWGMRVPDGEQVTGEEVLLCVRLGCETAGFCLIGSGLKGGEVWEYSLFGLRVRLERRVVSGTVLMSGSLVWFVDLVLREDMKGLCH